MNTEPLHVRSAIQRKPDSSAIHAAAEALTRTLLDARALLPRAGNNHPIPPSNPRASEFRHAMGHGRSKPFEYLLTVAQCDLADGVPFAVVRAPFDQLIHELEVLAVADYARKLDHPLPILIQRESLAETREEGKLNVAQEKVVCAPSDPVILEHFLREAPRYRATLDRVTALCRTQLAVVRRAPRGVA